MAEWFSNPYISTKSGSVAEGQMDLRGKLACDIVRHCALVAAKADGEDSTGRQRLLELNAKEVADKACDMADAMVNNFEERGWLKPYPSMEEHVTTVLQLEGLMESFRYKLNNEGREEVISEARALLKRIAEPLPQLEK